MDHERSIISHLVDWLTVAVVIAVSLALLSVNPDSHDFSIGDLSLSYAHRKGPKVPLWLLIVLAIVAPAATMAIASLRTQSSSVGSKYRRLNNGLLGLGISLGSATVILNIKNLAGKPRPDFLSICLPDLDKIEAHKVGGYGKGIDVMVRRGICQQNDHLWLNDAFRSFPSGYSTIAFACLCYTSVWLCRRFHLPLFVKNAPASNPRYLIPEDGAQPLLNRGTEEAAEETSKPSAFLPLPIYYLFIPYIPISLAIFIAGTRYFDFRNHGIDVIAGAAGGIFSASVGIRWTTP